MSKIKHWQVKKLGEICEIITGSTPSKSKPEYYGDSYPFFKPSDFDKSYFLQSAKDNLSILGIQKARFLPKKSVLVVCIGSIGKVGLTRAEGSCNQQINAIIANNELISPEFVYFYAISSKFQNLLKETSSATTLAILNKSKFENLEIPLPSLDDQNLIVKRIESCFEKIDFAISNFKKSKELIEIYKQSVLSHAFNGKLTNSNLNSWQVKKLGEIAVTSSGGTPSRNKAEFWENGSFYWIKSGELSDDYINYSEEKITQLAIDNSSSKILDKNTILVAMYGATVGKLGILNTQAATNQAICAIANKQKPLFCVKFLYYYLLSIRPRMINDAFGGAQKNISQSYLRQLPILLPALSEQNLIVSEIEKRFKAADNALNLIEQNLKKAEILKQSILSKAFNGRLVKDKK